MAIEFNKDDKAVKANTSKAGKGCTATLVIQIIFTILAVVLAMAPLLGAVFGVFLFGLYVVGAAITTVGSLFLALASKGFRNFWAKAWTVVVNVFKGSGNIRVTLKPYIIWMAIVVFVLSSIGFIYNTVYYFKKEKANKRKFIASCVLLGIAGIATIASMPVYLTA